MFGFILILGIIAGAVVFGLMMIVGVMLYEGKWTLPGTEARRLQHAQVNKEISTINLEILRNNMFEDDLQAKRELARYKHVEELDRVRDHVFARELEAPKTRRGQVIDAKNPPSDDGIPF